jgi:ubiquinone/menaquinone biosynthesis C-methylase UbiE
VVGMDGTRSNVLFSRRVHQQQNLSFVYGRAEELPFPDASFDAVINLESCNYYQPFRAFASEVNRVLRRRGALMLSTYATPDAFDGFIEAFEEPGLRLVDVEDVSSNVQAALRTFDFGTALIQRRAAPTARKMYTEKFRQVYQVDEVIEGHCPYLRLKFQKA